MSKRKPAKQTDAMAYLEAGAQIAYCYWALREIAKAPPKRSTINLMVDAATGKDKADASEVKKASLSLVACIIRNKRRIGEDVTQDIKMRQALKAFKP